MNRFAIYSLLIGLFWLSVLVRLPNLNRPLSKHHEYCTALSLVMFESWEQGGIARYKYVPVQLYPEPFTQRFYRESDHPLADETGNLYYLSHPPLAFYVPYFIFQVLNLPPSPAGLQIINVVFSGLSAFFLYRMMVLLFGFRSKKLFGPGLVAAGVYLFPPATLWFQGNVFFADLFSVNFFVICLYFTVRLLLDGKEKPGVDLSLFALSLALFCYADWLGFLFAFMMFVYASFKAFSSRFFLKVSLVCVVVVAATALLIGWQYSQINGLDAFLKTSLFRWQERGFGSAGQFSFGEASVRFFKKLWKIGIHYATGFLPVILLVTGLIMGIARQKTWKRLKDRRLLVMILLLNFFTVLIHHLIFLKYSAIHDFAVLKAAPFLSILAGGLSAIWLNHSKSVRIYSAFGLTVLLCITQYYYINRPGDTSWKGDRYDAMKNIGLEIKAKSGPDEVVFLNGIKGPQISFYAKRNIFFAPDSDGAKSVLERINAKKGRLFYVEGRKVVRMEPILSD